MPLIIYYYVFISFCFHLSFMLSSPILLQVTSMFVYTGLHPSRILKGLSTRVVPAFRRSYESTCTTLSLSQGRVRGGPWDEAQSLPTAAGSQATIGGIRPEVKWPTNTEDMTPSEGIRRKGLILSKQGSETSRNHRIIQRKC